MWQIRNPVLYCSEEASLSRAFWLERSLSATIPATPNLYSRYYNIFIKAAKPKEVKPKEELTSNTSPGKENLENARIEEEKVGIL